MSTVLVIFFLLCVLVSFAYISIRPPRHPIGIPSIPLYVTFLPLIKDVDQEETYREYLQAPLQAHGVVKIFFGGRWNLLLQKPQYVAAMFKDEDVFQKSGNQKKIPYSVLAEYTGDNIISSHGEKWKLYQGVIRPGLQRSFETTTIESNTRKLCELIDERQRAVGRGKGVLIPELLQRYTLANLSQVVLGCDFRTLEDENAPLSKLQLEVKPKIFNPIFLNFPFLDRFPIPSRLQARDLTRKFTDELTRIIAQSHVGRKCSLESKSLGERLVAARESGLLSETQFRHNCISIFLAGHENPQLLLVSVMYLLGQHVDIQEQLRNTVTPSAESSVPAPALQQLPLLTSVIYETLRMYPPISQLINRRTAVATSLGQEGEIHIPAGTYVGYNAYSTGRDPAAWGVDADEFRPGRWGVTLEDINKNYRRHSARAEFISFHGGRRACLGERYAMLGARTTIAELLRRFRWHIDPTWEHRMTPAGPLYAKALRLVFEDVAGSEP